MDIWLEKIWVRRKGSFYKQKPFLIFDSYRSYLIREMKHLIQQHSKLAEISGGLNKKMKSLDLSINKSF